MEVDVVQIRQSEDGAEITFPNERSVGTALWGATVQMAKYAGYTLSATFTLAWVFSMVGAGGLVWVVGIAIAFGASLFIPLQHLWIQRPLMQTTKLEVVGREVVLRSSGPFGGSKEESFETTELQDVRASEVDDPRLIELLPPGKTSQLEFLDDRGGLTAVARGIRRDEAAEVAETVRPLVRDA